MAKFTFSATVNYPETEAETPIYAGCNVERLCDLIRHLVGTEPDMTSALITIVKQKED